MPNYSTNDFECADKIKWNISSDGSFWKDVPCLLGFNRGGQFIDAVYAVKRMKKDTADGITYDVGQNGFNFKLNIYRYRYQTSGKMYGGVLKYGESALQEYSV